MAGDIDVPSTRADRRVRTGGLSLHEAICRAPEYAHRVRTAEHRAHRRASDWAAALVAARAVCAGVTWDVSEPAERAHAAGALEASWSVRSRRELLTVMHELLTVGHRALADHRRASWWQLSDEEAAAFEREAAASPDPDALRVLRQFLRVRSDERQTMSIDMTASDRVRLVELAQAGAAADLLSADETRDVVLLVAVDLRTHYGSWAEFGASVDAGRWFWSARSDDESADQDAHDRMVRRLLLAPDGPWTLVPWDLPLSAPSGAFVDALAVEFGRAMPPAEPITA